MTGMMKPIAGSVSAEELKLLAQVLTEVDEVDPIACAEKSHAVKQCMEAINAFNGATSVFTGYKTLDKRYNLRKLVPVTEDGLDIVNDILVNFLGAKVVYAVHM